MSRSKFRLHLSALAALALLTASPLAVAEPAAPAVCHGKDMLAEMQAKSPDRFAKVMDEAAKLGNSEAVFWKVEKEGVAPSYLLGTMHLTDRRIATIPEKAKAAIAQSRVVTLEVANLSDAAMQAAMASSPAKIVYTDGSTLEGKLTPDEFSKVKSLVGKSGMPGELAGLMRPWLVSLFLAISDCERAQMSAGAPVLDTNVEEEAKKHGVAVEGFETVEAQLDALASVPEDQQVAMLKVGLKYADRTNDLIETLVQMYLKRQIGAAMPFQIALAEEQGTPGSVFDGFKKQVLYDRNARMRDAALPMLAAGNAFIAVGALHLTGPEGLVALFREAGYTVTAVE